MITRPNRWRPALIIAFFCLILWALLFQISTPAWDAAFYYSYARSVAFDGDLKIDNDLRLSYPDTVPDFAAKEVDQDVTDTGRVYTVFAFGSSILLVPLLLILRLGAEFAHWLGLISVAPVGYEWYFSASVSAFSMIIGWIAFWLGFKTASAEVNQFSATASTVTLLFTTPLIYYLYLEPLYSHAASALTAALIVYVWYQDHDLVPSNYKAILLGALIGFSALVRWQNMIYLVLPAMSALLWWLAQESDIRRSSWRKSLTYLFLLFLSSLIVLSAQLFHWNLLFDTWLTVPQGQSFMEWQAPYLVPVLFSTFRGLIPWMPVFLLAVLGLILKVKEKPRLIVPLLAVIVLSLYVNGSARDWFAGAGYGPRRFSSELVIMIVGYAFLIQALPNKFRKPAAIIGGLILVLHQWILLRYGLSEKIGGRNLSMSPTFEWVDESYGTYFTQLTKHLPDIIGNPAGFLIWPKSFLHNARNGLWPYQQLTGILLSLVFVVVILVISQRLRYARIGARYKRWLLIFIGLTIIVALDLWLLISA